MNIEISRKTPDATMRHAPERRTWLPEPRRILRGMLPLFLAGLVLALPGALLAQERSQSEQETERARRGAGLRVGGWTGMDLTELDGASYSTLPHFQGWFQRGLDRHLAIESTLALWRRVQERNGEKVSTYIAPLFTSLKFYPGVGPEATVQPYVLGGGGLALGIDDREGTQGGLLGLGGSDGLSFHTGLGFKAGGGLDYWFSQALGLTVGARYQWIRFDGSPGGHRTYKGTVVDAGFTYRFQY
jgi:hypothetical protein